MLLVLPVSKEINYGSLNSNDPQLLIKGRRGVAAAPINKLCMDGLELLNNLNALDIETIASETVSDVTEVIADLNATQLSEGLRADGSETLPSYSGTTVGVKKGKSGLSGITDRVTLYDTGAFYRGLYASVQGTEIEYGSRDGKADKLQEKYSTSKGSIFGLNEDSKDELVTGHLEPTWHKKISEATGLEFS